MDAQKNNVALTHPYHEGKWCCKFGRILSSCLGEDSVTDRQMDWRMDGGINSFNIAFLKKHGDNKFDQNCQEMTQLLLFEGFNMAHIGAAILNI